MVSFNLESILASTIFHSDKLAIWISVGILSLNASVWGNGFGASAITSVVDGWPVVLSGSKGHGDSYENL